MKSIDIDSLVKKIEKEQLNGIAAKFINII